jgi:signal transduction histidine kinase
MTDGACGVYRGHVRRPPVRLHRLRIDPLRLDCLAAALLTLALELEVWIGSAAAHERIAIALLGPLVTGALAVRRVYPTIAGITAGVLVALIAALWGPPQVISEAIAWACALYGLAVWAPPRRFAVGAAIIAVANLFSGAAVGPNLGNGVSWGLGTLLALLLVRRVVWDRDQRAQIAERERDVAAREAVVEERARIARELHDVIAHNVSMIVVQAGAERRVLDEASATREVLQTIEQIGRSALTETRRLLGMLRSDAENALAPQPRLEDVPKLVTQVREAGLPVELRIDGEPRELPVGIELSAYRIVQEALTNALKHAGDAHAAVRIRYGDDSLELEIVDDGADNGSLAAGGGHGLVGMRERVALYGGRFDARPDPEGGFAVRAKLPIA